MSRPFILVPGRWAGVIDGRESPRLFARRTLLDAVIRGCGEPVLVWPDRAAPAGALRLAGGGRPRWFA